MFRFLVNSMRPGKRMAVLLLLLLCVAVPFSRAAKKKKVAPAPTLHVGPRNFPFDPKALVWPSPPNIARVRWMNYFAGARIDYTTETNAKPKASWMDRLAGGQPE